jgi:hypothetical protein
VFRSSKARVAVFEQDVFNPRNSFKTLEIKPMNTAELIYENVQVFPESLALEVLDFVEFLKNKNQALLEQEREIARKIQIGIEQADNDMVIPLDDAYIERLNKKIEERLAAKV